MSVADLPLISRIRVAAVSLVGLDGAAAFSTDGDEAWPWQPSSAAPAQAPPEAMKERRERTKINLTSLRKGEFRLHRNGGTERCRFVSYRVPLRMRWFLEIRETGETL
jgi:hypothetical protein